MKTKHRWWIGQLRGESTGKSETSRKIISMEGREQEKPDCIWSEWMNIFHPYSLQRLGVWMKDGLSRKLSVAGGRLSEQQRERRNGEAWREGISKWAKREEFYFSHCNMFHIFYFGQDVLTKKFPQFLLGMNAYLPLSHPLPFLVFPQKGGNINFTRRYHLCLPTHFLWGRSHLSNFLVWEKGLSLPSSSSSSLKFIGGLPQQRGRGRLALPIFEGSVYIRGPGCIRRSMWSQM